MSGKIFIAGGLTGGADGVWWRSSADDSYWNATAAAISGGTIGVVAMVCNANDKLFVVGGSTQQEYTSVDVRHQHKHTRKEKQRGEREGREEGRAGANPECLTRSLCLCVSVQLGATWVTRGTGSAPPSGVPMGAVGRSYHKAVLIPNSQNLDFLIIGGDNSGTSSSSVGWGAVWRYTSATDLYTLVCGIAPWPLRAHHAVAYVDPNRLIIAGGLAPGNTELSDVWSSSVRKHTHTRTKRRHTDTTRTRTETCERAVKYCADSHSIVPAGLCLCVALQDESDFAACMLACSIVAVVCFGC